MSKLSRRQFIKLSSTAAAAAILAACTPPATAEPTKPAATTEPTKPPAPTATPKPAAPVKVVFIESWFGVPQYKESIDPVTQALTAKAQSEGVNIQFESMILDDHANKYAAMYAAGADFTCAFDAPWYKMTTLRNQKALSAIEGMVDSVGPKLKAEITDKIYSFNFEKGPDGNMHLYGIPTAYYYGGTSGITLRDDLRIKYNVAKPDPSVGWSSAEPYLQAIAENEKGMYPFANAKYSPISIGHMSQGYWGWSPLGELGVTCILKTFDKSEYKLVDSETEENYVNRVKMLRSWWEKGWINKADLPLSAGSETVEKDYLIPGKAASCLQNDAEVKAYQEFNPIMKQANKDADLKGYDMTGLSTGKWKGLGLLKQWNFVVVNASAPKEKQEAAIQWWNWLVSSQDNIDLWLMGIEGKNWKKEDNMLFSEIAGTDAATNYRRQWYVSGVSGRFQRLSNDIIPEAKNIIEANSNEANWIFNPFEGFSVDRKPMEETLTKIAGIADEASHGMGSGQLPADESIAKFKKMYDDAGRQDAKAILQKQLDDYIANFKA